LLPGYESLKNVPVPIIQGQVANTDAINKQLNTGNSTNSWNVIPERPANQSLTSYQEDLLNNQNSSSLDIYL